LIRIGNQLAGRSTEVPRSHPLDTATASL
jgi:hypothetical protein